MGQEDEEGPESFRSALAQIRHLRSQVDQLESYAEGLQPMLDALQGVDPQTLPEHIAKLVADWKAGP